MHWLIPNPIVTEVPSIRAGDILIDSPGLAPSVESVGLARESRKTIVKKRSPVLGHVSLATGSVKACPCIWFEFFPQEYPFYVISRESLAQKFQALSQKTPGLDVPAPLGIVIPWTQILRTLKEPRKWLWKIQVSVDGTISLQSEARFAAAPAFTGTVWGIPVVECFAGEGTCGKEFRWLISQVTILSWKNTENPLAPEMAVKVGQTWVEQKHFPLETCPRLSKKELMAKLRICYPSVTSKIPYLQAFGIKDTDISRILEKLGQSLRCGEFVVLVWQLGLWLSLLKQKKSPETIVDQVRAALPMDGRFCNPIEVSRLAIEAPHFWSRQELGITDVLQKSKRPSLPLLDFVA